MKTTPALLAYRPLLTVALLSVTALFTACQKREDVVPADAVAAQIGTQSLGVAADALAYWKFDGNANDAAGSSNGTVVGAAFVPGISGQALQFDGNDYVDVPAGRAYSRDGSISLWVKTSQLNGRLLFNTQLDSDARADAMYLGLSDGKPQLFFGGLPDFDPRPFSLVGTQRINNGQWHHVAATWTLSTIEPVGSATLYVDGVLVVNDESGPAADGSTNYSASDGSFDFSRAIRLGGSQPAANFFVGALDEVSLYNRVLTATEITALAAPPVAAAEYIVDNGGAGFATAGSWTTSTGLPGFFGPNYLHDGDAQADAADVATWTSPITTARAGTYDVYMRWTAERDRPDAAPVQVNYQGGIANLTVNQKLNGGQWVKIGTWPFTGGSGDYVRLTGADAGYTIADAVRFVKK